MFLNHQMKAWYTNVKQSTYKTNQKPKKKNPKKIKKSHLNSERQVNNETKHREICSLTVLKLHNTTKRG